MKRSPELDLDKEYGRVAARRRVGRVSRVSQSPDPVELFSLVPFVV